MQKISIIIAFLIALLVGCTQIDKLNGVNSDMAADFSFSAGKTENTSETEDKTDISSYSDEITGKTKPSESRTNEKSSATAEISGINGNYDVSKPANPPAASAQSQSQPPSSQASSKSEPSNSAPPTSSEAAQSNPDTTPSTPAIPEYEVLGLDYLNGVLKGMNDRRAALGYPPATLDSALSDECLVQAKRMADAERTFHSEKPTGCEGVAKVPYNFPAELMGDLMCGHVARFTYESTTKIGVAAIKSGNNLFIVVQCT